MLWICHTYGGKCILHFSLQCLIIIILNQNFQSSSCQRDLCFRGEFCLFLGFHLSANVECRGYREVWYGGPPGKKSPYLYINLKFDRGKITETYCPCENSNRWCFHIIAVCLARIFLKDKCLIKPPLSDSLNNLKSYEQLRTFTQYLIAEFSDRRIVESAQNVLDRMLKPQSSDDDAINETWGAPDPTAGPGVFRDFVVYVKQVF